MIRRTIAIGLFSAVASAATWCAAADSPLAAEYVFPAERYHNHSPSIVETPEGDLLVCWFHGVGERTDNTLVLLGARKKRGADTWSEPFLMADNKNLPDQNPTLFIDPQKRLWLFWISSLDNEKRGHFLKYRISTDYEGDGPPRWTWQDALFCFPQDLEQTYSEAVDQMLASGAVGESQAEEYRQKRALAGDKLWHRLGWMPRQPPIMLSETRMMLGLYSDVWNCSLMAFTDDGGEHWEFSRPMILSSFINIQPALVRKQNGNVTAFMRSRSVTRRAESSDGGLTWTEDPLDEIRCNGSSVAALGLASGNWLLAVNDARGRAVLSLYLSDDEGRTWKRRRALENFADAQGSGQYPTLIQSADGVIHAVYSHTDVAQFGDAKMRTIKHVSFDEAWLQSADAGN